MYQEKGFKTIFDDVKAKPIINATIKEDEIIKPNKSFSINNDKFDNRRENLRVIKQMYNVRASRRVPKNSPTGIIGVGLYRGNKFRARITVDRKTIYLGIFDKIEDAIAARNEAKIKYHSF